MKTDAERIEALEGRMKAIEEAGNSTMVHVSKETAARFGIEEGKYCVEVFRAEMHRFLAELNLEK